MKFTEEQRQAVAAKYDGYANGLEEVAADLESRGYHDAAEIQRGTAQGLRDVADAARTSSSALARIY